MFFQKNKKSMTFNGSFFVDGQINQENSHTFSSKKIFSCFRIVFDTNHTFKTQHKD